MARHASLFGRRISRGAAEKTVLYRVVHQHLETMLSEAAERSEHGFGYPRFIERAFRPFITCGHPARGKAVTY